MKATKLIALGLVGLTSLGLAATVNAENSDNSVGTEASITFTTENIAGDQDGQDGKPVDPEENPIVEAPQTVNGWKFGVPNFMLFEGLDDNTVKIIKDTKNNQEVTTKYNLYNFGANTNKYYFAGTKYEGQEDRKAFPIRFMNQETPRTGTSKLKVSIQRDKFMVTTGGSTKELEIGNTEKAYIKIPRSSLTKENVSPGEGLDNAIQTLNISDDVTLAKADINPELFNVELSEEKTIGLLTMGTPGKSENNVELYLPQGLNQLKKVKKATVTTQLTWTVESGDTASETN